jgi:hypothetical protein
VGFVPDEHGYWYRIPPADKDTGKSSRPQVLFGHNLSLTGKTRYPFNLATGVHPYTDYLL